MSAVTRTPWVTFGCFGTLVECPAASGVIRPMADVEPMLAQLRARRYRLGVLTNCSDREFEVVHHTFRQPFDLFVTSERIRGRKPSPWHFRAFEQMARVSRKQWVHVACSWNYDIVPASALGVATVWLDREGSSDPRGAGVRVHTTAEAIDVIVARLEQFDVATAV